MKNLLPTHRSRDTVHAQCLCLKTHSEWYPMRNIKTHAAQNLWFDTPTRLYPAKSVDPVTR